MKVSSILKAVGELGFISIYKNNKIYVTPPAINVHQSRLEPFVRFIQEYKLLHPEFRYFGFFTLYDAWREHAEPSDSPSFVLGTPGLLKAYIGTGTAGEPGRFIQPPHLKNIFPVFAYPVLAFGRHRNDPFTQLVPDTDFLCTFGYEALKSEIDCADIGWKSKKPLLYWRGARHGFAYRAYCNGQTNSQRALLVEWSLKNPDCCDAMFSHTTARCEQLGYKYLIDVDGEVNAWSGLFWKLYSNSLVFKVNSHYEQWYYQDLKPWIHYIPVNGDLSDLREKFEWAMQNNDECCQIALNGRVFATKLTYRHVLESFEVKCNHQELMKMNEVKPFRPESKSPQCR